MKKKKILIVDDNMNNVQVLAGILENNGFDLEFALNGPDALQWLEDEHFDLVLLDIMMPVMDGFEVCRIIRGKEKTHEIPIIFLTAKTDRESLMLGFRCGGNDYLSKPYDQGELLARVNTHLELKQSRDQLKRINAILEEKVTERTRQLQQALQKVQELNKNLQELECVCEIRSPSCPGHPDARQVFRSLIDDLEKDYEHLEQHYKGVSLFIESLFRLSHFQKGQFVLRRRTTRVTKEIIEPQLNLYIDKLQERHIEIDTGAGVMPDEDLALSVDKGLMSQVYANLFSNAVKYARRNYEGRKYMAYGRDHLKDYFGPGKDGIKFNVFTTGPHLPPEDVPHIFDEGYRGTNIDGEVGTGRGLFFVRNVVETHGGEVGYEATPGGNNFYFVLPSVVTPEGPLPGDLDALDHNEGKP